MDHGATGPAGQAAEAEDRGVTELALTVPRELVEAIAERVAAILEPAAERRSPWYDVDGAATYMGCSRQRVYDLKSAGRLPASGGDGRSPRFHVAVMDAYLVGGPEEAKAVAGRLPRAGEGA
ncbi:MAG: helix-turn-helix domain-containing protein [Gaiellaceae bacterium]